MSESTPNQTIEEFLKFDYRYPESPKVARIILDKLGISENTVMYGNITYDFLATQTAETLVMVLGAEGAEDFIKRVFENLNLLQHFKNNPKTIEELVNIRLREEGFFENPEFVDAYITNSQQRKHEGDLQAERFEELQANNIKPTEEEMSAGVFKYELEQQVADAVFTLRAKGYNTFESGFTSEVVEGIQSIGFSKEIPVNFEIPKTLIEYLKQMGVEIRIEDEDDRYSIFLIPTKRTLTMEKWKEVWDVVAETLPPLNEIGSSVNVKTPVADQFREENM